MSKIMEVFTANEVEDMTGYTGNHIRRLIKNEKLGLIENEDYRKTQKGSYLLTDIAIQKITEYRNSSPKVKSKDEE